MKKKQTTSTEPRTRESLIAEIYVRDHRANTSIRAIAKHLGISTDEVRRIYDAHYKEWESQKTPKKTPQGRPVIAIPIGGGLPIYYSTVRAADNDGFYSCMIYDCLNGKRKQYKGFIWKLARE
mgnify:CR=1 FL=1